VRLAPDEQFVPAFEILDTSKRVSARLLTNHRDGTAAGPPAAMLSAGNLNTAALTLFLALHLSATPRLPWLLLDDPVQSMDEVHVSQFAALLRTLTKQYGRQLVIAVHERPLFEYLTLELSPSQEGDRLAAIDLSSAPDGSTTVHPQIFTYETDAVQAAA
jgi:DNA repair protein SbcC/Rad50